MNDLQAQRRAPRGFLGATGASKVPQVTLVFWVIKILTTAMGESTSDYLVHRFNPYLAVVGGFVVFAAALAVQFVLPRYQPWAYWSAVVMVAVFGTMAADVTHIEFGVPYAVSTALFAVVLAAVFVAWHASERTLSIHSIRTRRREAFYWAAVLAAFAMGTAAGDLAATTLGLGYLSAGIAFAVIFAVPALGWRLGAFGGIFAFWFAYVTTRPLGASFADYMGKGHAVGGLAWGDGPVAFALSGAIVVLVAYLWLSGVDREPEPSGVPSSASPLHRPLEARAEESGA